MFFAVLTFRPQVFCEVVLASSLHDGACIEYRVREWVTFLTCQMVAKLFYSTRLETRTKESNTCANSWVVKLVGTMKVIIEMLALVAD